MEPGLIAALTFLTLTGVGAAAQVAKLAGRERAWRRGELPEGEICAGLLSVRELWSYTAFLLFALSGFTRPYTDYYLILSRTPVVVLTTVIIGYLARHGAPGAKRAFILALCGDAVLGIFVLILVAGFTPSGTPLPYLIDGSVAIVGGFLFYGKLAQAREMYRTGRTEAVSWFREGGLVLKDLTGLWYAITVGSDLLFVGITHLLSVTSSSAICGAKYLVESTGRGRG